MDRMARTAVHAVRGGGAGFLALPALAMLLLAATGASGQPAARLLENGRRYFVDNGCYGCHTVGKYGTQGIAPDLSQVGAKYDRAYLAKWLEDPASQKPTAHMPKLELGKADADALAAYLSSLR